MGNAYLKRAFSEAAVLFLRDNPAGQKYLTRPTKKHGSGKALTLLAQTLGRAVYYMLKTPTGLRYTQVSLCVVSGAGETDASPGVPGVSLRRRL
jgi:hypothetical protein